MTELRPAGWLPVSRRKIVSGSGPGGDAHTTFCPFQEKTVAIAECHSCGFLDGIAKDTRGDPTAVLCARDLGERESPLHPDSEPSEKEETSTWFDLRTPIASLMTRQVTCVTKDVSIETLRDIFVEKGFGAIPVVDTDGVPIGIVTKTDLLRDFDAFEGFESEPERRDPRIGPRETATGFSEGELARATAAEVMSQAVVSLPEEAPVSRAAAVMAFEGIQHLIVISTTERTVIGLLSSSDVMRAMGRRAGYRLPPRRMP